MRYPRFLHITLFRVRLFYRFDIRHLKTQKWRTLAVILGICLGACVFTSVRIAVHASLDAFTRSMDLISGAADQVVFSPGGRVPETLVARIASNPLVQAAAPMMTAYVTPIPDNKQDKVYPFLLIGIDPLADLAVRDWQTQSKSETKRVIWQDLISKPFTMIIGSELLQQFETKMPDTLRLRYGNRQHTFNIIGKLASKGLALVDGGRVAITDISSFQEFTHILGQVDRIDIIYDNKSVSAAVKAEIQAWLPNGCNLGSPDQTRNSGRKLIDAYQANLSILSVASLFVGMFLVYSLVALNATARRKELAIIRSIGGSPGLIMGLFLSEGFFLGLIGWMIAIPISSIMVMFLIHGISQTISNLFVNVYVDRLALNGWEILFSLAITLFVSCLAALQPALQAMQVSPKEAMVSTRIQSQDSSKVHKLFLIGISMLIAVWPLSMMPPVLGYSISGYIATLFLVIGFAFFAPFSLRLIGKASASLLKRISGEPGRMAGRYIKESGMRTAISIGALITAVALFCSLSIMVHSFRNTVLLWVNQTISGDLFVSPRLAELNHFKDPLPQSFIKALDQFKNETDIVPLRRFYLTYGSVPYQFDAIGVATFAKYGRFIWIKGDADKSQTLLAQGKGVIISEVFAAKTGLSVGDRFTAQIRDIRLNLPVLGVIRDYRTRGGAVFYDFKHLQQVWSGSDDPEKSGNPLIPDGLRLYFKNRQIDIKTAGQNLASQLHAIDSGAVDITLGTELRQTVLDIFDDTFAVTFVLLLIALFVATLGIATTLTILVLDRKWQFNTLSAIGADFKQIRNMILSEAFLLVITGQVLGVVCGFVLSYLLIYVINYQSFGWTFLYQVDWSMLALSFPLILATAFLAAIPAIRLVFKMPPSQVLRESLHGN